MQSAINHSVEALAVSGNNGQGTWFAVENGAEPVASYPSTIVLQPCRELTQDHSLVFQQSLEAALDLAQESVIVDLLWVEETDAAGIAALVVGLEKAACLGKTLSFQSMRHQTRVAVEVEWQRQRHQRLGLWHDRTAANLAQFLGTNRKTSVLPGE
jgi:anti-anti-sigma regulatory factor